MSFSNEKHNLISLLLLILLPPSCMVAPIGKLANKLSFLLEPSALLPRLHFTRPLYQLPPLKRM